MLRKNRCLPAAIGAAYVGRFTGRGGGRPLHAWTTNAMTYHCSIPGLLALGRVWRYLIFELKKARRGTHETIFAVK